MTFLSYIILSTSSSCVLASQGKPSPVSFLAFFHLCVALPTVFQLDFHNSLYIAHE